MSRKNDFWLGKIKLWFALRGGIAEWREKHHTEKLCEKCRYWQKSNRVRPLHQLVLTPNGGYRNFEVVMECKRKKEFRSRLMVNTELTDVQFLPHESSAHPFHYICAEWVKDV